MPVVEQDARATHEQFRELMQRLPPDLGRVLKLDPTLLRTDSYLGQYPSLAAFLTRHPEVAHNPAYYLDFVPSRDGEWGPADSKTEAIRAWRNLMEAAGVFFIFMTVAGFIAWFVRTFIDYRRWLRLSKIQTDVHNKLLERFSGSGELLTYIQSPAGRRFLESAPIPLDAAPRAMSAPLARILWAVQGGVVFTVLGFGLNIVSNRMIEDIAQPLSVFGILAIALGLGLIASSIVSYLLARQLRLLDPAPPGPVPERPDSPLV